jgi:predicted transglutaminase-like cysteine proteinase
MHSKAQCLIVILGLLVIPVFTAVAGTSGNTVGLFGYQQIEKHNLSLFPQWLSVLERHVLDTQKTGDCESRDFNKCHLAEWQSFLSSIRTLPDMEQIKRVNRYANSREYILDSENYGVTDYWATPKEFLINNGDCEDFAIIKMLSMKWLGYDVEKMRVVVVQDTNLRIPHAIMAIDKDNDTLILDNQIEQVISHLNVFHYVPVYSVNENSWWMHVPQ